MREWVRVDLLTREESGIAMNYYSGTEMRKSGDMNDTSGVMCIFNV